MNEFRGPRAVADDALLRCLDGESPRWEREVVQALAPDGADAARLRELREASEAFSALLADAPAPALPRFEPGRTRVRRGLPRAAAAALLLFAGAAAALPTTRGAVVEGVERIRALLGGPAVEAPPPGGVGRTTVRFSVTAPGVTVTVRHPQAGGTLLLERGEGRTASATAEAGVELRVLPGGVEVLNDPASTGNVRVVLPRGIVRVRVRIAGTERRVDVRGGERVRLPLGPPG